MSKSLKISDLENPCASQLEGINEYDVVNRSKNSKTLAATVLTWYKPSEKLPEIGDEIVIYDFYEGLTGEIVVNKYYIENRMIDDRPWTYAINFNLPKRED